MNPFRSYAFTVRPKLGLQTPLEEGLVKWLSKHHGFLCTEMEDEAKHAHGVIYLEKPKLKGDLNKSLESICSRLVPDWDANQNMVLRRGTKICYNDNFIDEYLSKEDNVIFSKIPEDTSQYYPSKEEQEKVQAKSNAVDKKFHQWETDFLNSIYYEEFKKTPLQLYISQFLEDMMFSSRRYVVTVCPKKRREYAKALYLYVIKQSDGLQTMYEKDIQITDLYLKSMIVEQQSGNVNYFN